MDIALSLLTVLSIASTGSAIFLLIRFLKVRNLNYNITTQYTVDVSNQKKKFKAMKERVDELESGIEKNFAVSVRKDVTTIECVFDKVEMAFLMAGVFKLINDEKSGIEDKEFYIKLYKKIQEHIEKMEDPVDES